MVDRVLVTPAAASLIARLRATHGDLLFHQSGGCCDGSSPMCYLLGEFRVGAQDIRLGAIEGCPVYIGAAQFEYWAHTQLTIDVVPGRGGGFSQEAWTNLERSFESQARVNGTIYGRVKGGFTVDLGGAVAFLPGSQVDIRPVRDVGPLMGTPQPFQILKMDRARGNIVVSRRAVLEETRAEQRSELIQGLKEGMILDGVVKNITDYGAFVDLGGVDGLLHVTDIAWRRINHPSGGLANRSVRESAGDPLQRGYAAHFTWEKAAGSRSMGGSGGQISAWREV